MRIKHLDTHKSKQHQRQTHTPDEIKHQMKAPKHLPDCLR